MIQRVEHIWQYSRTLAKYIGPGFMIAVGYLDPGNWATDMSGGSRFGYRLLFMIMLSNLIAVFLQNLAIKLGTVSGLDLAAASRRFLPRSLNLCLYVLAEAAIIATDIAEVIGSAIALNLLFPSIPLPVGVIITAADVFIILLFYNDDPGSTSQRTSSRLARYFEWFVMALVATVGICFIIELTYSDVVLSEALLGYLPSTEIFMDTECLYIAIGIMGATVMPHNLYLHSYIVQSRCQDWRARRPLCDSVASKSRTDTQEEDDEYEEDDDWIMLEPPSSLGDEQENGNAYSPALVDAHQLRHYLTSEMQSSLHYSFIDLLVALCFAFFVNSAILVVAAANFHFGPANQQPEVSDLFAAHALLKTYVSPVAAMVFALALLCAGQSSTLTATLAGQVVMSGFLGMTTRPWIRRIVTRLIAIVPAMAAACLAGRSGLSQMLVASQVALSIQLPFAVIPLVVFTARKDVMALDLFVRAHPHVPASYPSSTLSWIPKPLHSWITRAKSTFYFVSSSSHSPTTSPVPARTHSRPDWTAQDEEEQAVALLPRDTSATTTRPTFRWPDPIVYTNGHLTNVIAVIIAVLLVCLNLYLVISSLSSFSKS